VPGSCDKFSYTWPTTTGSYGDMDFSEIPDPWQPNSTIVGVYHTHPCGDQYEDLSDHDMSLFPPIGRYPLAPRIKHYQIVVVCTCNGSIIPGFRNDYPNYPK